MNDETVFDVWVHGIISVDYLLQLDGAPAAGETCHIEREIRRVGGGAANCALALASWGASVCLTGNPLGNDGNGRFVAKELGIVPNLTLRVPLLDDVETPYYVVLGSRNEAHALLVRHEFAKHYVSKNDHEVDASTRKLITWPSARLATCDGTSPHHFLRNMHDRGIPIVAEHVLEPAAPLAEVVFWPFSPLSPADEEGCINHAREMADAWNTIVVGLSGVQSYFWCRTGAEARRHEVPNVGDKDPLGSIGAADVFRAGLLWF
jgi:sugar/nucleoside kinase (ribokinase family)